MADARLWVVCTQKYIIRLALFGGLLSNKANKIIVMGGSFNPPTIAHLKLMQFAIAQMSTRDPYEDIRGIFIPSSDAYVCRKMSKKIAEADHTVLPEKIRLDIICWMAL